VSLLCTWSILYTVMQTLEDGIHCGRLLEENFLACCKFPPVVCDEDRIDYSVNFYSKSNRLSISIFTVILIGIVTLMNALSGEAVGEGGERLSGEAVGAGGERLFGEAVGAGTEQESVSPAWGSVWRKRQSPH